MWKGGILYEHTHRVIASVVGLMTLVLAIWVSRIERRAWVRILAAAALVMVVVQGILGGLTVKFLLPLPISVSHATIAQAFFVITILTAYALSREREQRTDSAEHPAEARRALWVWVFISVVIVQLMLGAVMRHGMKHKGGVAIPDFPTAASAWLPSFDQSMLDSVIKQRTDLIWERGLDIEADVTMVDITVHYLHRIGAVIILVSAALLGALLVRDTPPGRKIKSTLCMLAFALIAQTGLGVATVLTQKGQVFATAHVALGAAVLGIAALLAVRCWPVGSAGQEAHA
jgi:cytochrome c oxidase assembly protein subunit 15